jgi:hypothetical protein
MVTWQPGRAKLGPNDGITAVRAFSVSVGAGAGACGARSLHLNSY